MTYLRNLGLRPRLRFNVTFVTSALGVTINHVVDCYDDYEAIYDDLSMVNCWLCGLACHGCRNQQKTQEADLYMQSRGNVWVCYECKKEAPVLKKKNENWEEETEQPPEKKAGPG